MARVIFAKANLVDGEHPAKRNTTVVVEGDKITRVAAGDGVASRPGDRVVDLAGKTLMPGMYSCHFHAAYHNLGGSPSQAPLGLEKSPTYLALRAAENAKLALMCGFTGIVGGSTAYDIDASLKAAIEDGMIQGPRVMPSSRDLITTGDSNDRAPWYWKLGGVGAIRICDGADEFRKAVREEIKMGADIIKLYPTGGHGVRLPRDTQAINRAEIDAAVDAAHALGKKVRGHIASKRTILECLDAGVDVIDHADRMDAECIEAFLKTGAFVAPSLYFPLSCLEPGERRDGPQRWRHMREDFEYTCSMLPEANAAGVKFVVGDDFGAATCPHGDYAKELEVYVKHAGISPLEVITWATKNGAELMGMADRLGTVTEGKLADLLVVDGDPTVDITVLQDRDRLLAIMKGGEFVKDMLG